MPTFFIQNQWSIMQTMEYSVHILHQINRNYSFKSNVMLMIYLFIKNNGDIDCKHYNTMVYLIFNILIHFIQTKWNIWTYFIWNTLICYSLKKTEYYAYIIHSKSADIMTPNYMLNIPILYIISNALYQHIWYGIYEYNSFQSNGLL